METLRTQVDSLNWEIQRLSAENRKLRERDPAASERVDCEAELERAKADDVAEMTGRVRTLENQLADSVEIAEDAGRRASEAEERAAGLRQRLEELSTAQETPEAAESGAPSEGKALELEEALRQSEL